MIEVTARNPEPASPKHRFASENLSVPNTSRTEVPADTDEFAFTADGPWVVRRDSIDWLASVDGLRAACRREVPTLTRPSRVPPGARVLTVIGRLGGGLGPWFVRRRLGKLRGRLAPIGQRLGGLTTAEASQAELSLRLRTAAERLGSTYIKLGQIISAGEGLFPAELVNEFKKCRDQVPAEPWSTVRRVIEEELGTTVDSTFAWIDHKPLAAASIAQVHAAELVTGERVVVKVQRPQVHDLVHRDLKVMSWLAPHLVGRIPVAALANPPALVELFAETIVEELDFRLEASNMLDIAEVLHDLGQDGYVVPRPHPRLVTKRMLVMERMDGFNFDDVVGMHDAGIDTEAVIRTGMIAFMEGAMVHGIFHGDLHGGNLLVLADGRTALLDFGIVGRMSPDRRQAFLRLMLGATTNDVMTQLTAMRDLGALPMDSDLAAVMRDLRLDQPPIDPTTLTGDQLVTEVQRVVKALLGYGARLPKELMLYVKNMVFLDGAIARLAPDLDILAEIANISLLFAERHGERFGAELGIDHRALEVDLDGFKASFGLDSSVNQLTYRELQERRALIQRRMRETTGR